MLKLRGRSSGITAPAAGANKLSFENLRCHGCGRSDNLLTFVFCHKCGKPAGHHSCVTLQGRPICGPCRGGAERERESAGEDLGERAEDLPYWTKGNEFMSENTSPVFGPLTPAAHIKAKLPPPALANTSPPILDLSNLPPPPDIPGLKKLFPRSLPPVVSRTPNKVPLIPSEEVDAVVDRAIKALDAMLPPLESPSRTPMVTPKATPHFGPSKLGHPPLPPTPHMAPLSPPMAPISPPGTPSRSYPGSRMNSRPGSPKLEASNLEAIRKRKWAQYVSENLPPIFKLPPKVQRSSSVPNLNTPKVSVGLHDATIIQNLIVNQHYYNGPNSPYVSHTTMTEPDPSDTDSEGEYTTPALVGDDAADYANKKGKGVKRRFPGGIKQEQIEPDPKRRRVARKGASNIKQEKRKRAPPNYVRRYPEKRAPRTRTSGNLEAMVQAARLGPEGYECPEPGCGKRVRLKCHFTRHLKLHSKSIEDRRPHKCPMCPRRFAQRCNLKAHIATHKANRHQPFSCKVCGLTFTRKHGVKRHIERRHKSTKAKVDKLIMYCTPPKLGRDTLEIVRVKVESGKRRRPKTIQIIKIEEEDLDIPPALLTPISPKHPLE